MRGANIKREHYLVICILVVIFVIYTTTIKEPTVEEVLNQQLDVVVKVYGNKTCKQVDCRLEGKDCDSETTNHLPCTKQGYMGRCVNSSCEFAPIEKVMGWETFREELLNLPYDTAPVFAMTLKEKEKFKEAIKKLLYWDRPSVSKKAKPIIPRYLSTKIHHSGFNNRRMSLEVAYALAFALNRTLILQPPHPLVPYKMLGYDEKFWDLNGMKNGWPTLTYKEYRALPNYDQLSTNIHYVNWTQVTESILAIPFLPIPGATDYDHYKKWREPSGVNLFGRPYESKDFQEHQHVYINSELFVHFYRFIYPGPQSSITSTDILRIVRDHFHLRPEIFEITANLLQDLPPCFSAMHIRRGDLDYATAKLEPSVIFENTEALFFKSEHVYIATDQREEEFEQSFGPIFRKRYKIHTFKELATKVQELNMDPKWIPLIEMIICSQGRIFVGTRFSTMTSYIHRLRGYMIDTCDLRRYFTERLYQGPDDHQEDNEAGWDKEHAMSYEPIRAELNPVPKFCRLRISLKDDWNINIPHWDAQTINFDPTAHSGKLVSLKDYPNVTKFLSHFVVGKNAIDHRISIQKFTQLENYLNMLRDNQRNMFIAPIDDQGYLEKSGDHFSLLVKVNVVWESYARFGKFLGIFGAQGEIGFINFTMDQNSILDFKLKGLKYPPPFEVITDIDQTVIEVDRKVAGYPTLYDDCDFKGHYVFLGNGYYENPWLTGWGVSGVSSLDSTDCYLIHLMTKDGKKLVVNDTAYECLEREEKWINDKTHNIFVTYSDSESCKNYPYHNH